ncbi:hypothetical protein [Deinococcus fonticola]|uniref:hypothetical protein n=1 Tax=Deinococcus fonticola TaxID=2528713 RepID=UPI0010754B5F|nr:hypothetical protein [Deinococcus fonticola]
MQKVGLTFLLALLAFALIFAVLPTQDQTNAETGAHLQDVQLTLYPMRDPDAVWRFSAARVNNDPIAGVTTLTDLGGGQRLLRHKTPQGQYSGQEELDATLSTQTLRIDNQDDILTEQARMTLVKSCADIDMIGDAGNPVKIQQGVGFSAPRTVLDAPGMNVKFENLQMDFETTILNQPRMTILGDLDSKERCVNGRRVKS